MRTATERQGSYCFSLSSQPNAPESSLSLLCGLHSFRIPHCPKQTGEVLSQGYWGCRLRELHLQDLEWRLLHVEEVSLGSRALWASCNMLTVLSIHPSIHPSPHFPHSPLSLQRAVMVTGKWDSNTNCFKRNTDCKTKSMETCWL